MSLALGIGVAKLLREITWDEWLDWQSYADLEPFGEQRADLRQAALISYQLAPYMPAGTELPQVVWPYFEAADPIDTEAAMAAIAEHQERWDQWMKERDGVGSRFRGTTNHMESGLVENDSRPLPVCDPPAEREVTTDG